MSIKISLTRDNVHPFIFDHFDNQFGVWTLLMLWFRVRETSRTCMERYGVDTCIIKNLSNNHFKESLS